MLAFDAVGLDQVLPIELDNLLLQLSLAQRCVDLAILVAESKKILLLGGWRLQERTSERDLSGSGEALLRRRTELPSYLLHRELWPRLTLRVL